jgi:hypothetical protein
MAFFASHCTISVRPVANSNRWRGPEECTVVTVASPPTRYVVVTDTLGGWNGAVGIAGVVAVAGWAGAGLGFGFDRVVCAIAGIAMETMRASATAIGREQFICCRVPARAAGPRVRA